MRRTHGMSPCDPLISSHSFAVLSPTAAQRVPGSLDLAKNCSFLIWKLTRTYEKFMEGTNYQLR